MLLLGRKGGGHRRAPRGTARTEKPDSLRRYQPDQVRGSAEVRTLSVQTTCGPTLPCRSSAILRRPWAADARAAGYGRRRPVTRTGGLHVRQADPVPPRQDHRRRRHARRRLVVQQVLGLRGRPRPATSRRRPTTRATPACRRSSSPRRSPGRSSRSPACWPPAAPHVRRQGGLIDEGPTDWRSTRRLPLRTRPAQHPSRRRSRLDEPYGARLGGAMIPNSRRTRLAAYQPPRPCTPGPGGVDAEQRYTPGAAGEVRVEPSGRPGEQLPDAGAARGDVAVDVVLVVVAQAGGRDAPGRDDDVPEARARSARCAG